MKIIGSISIIVVSFFSFGQTPGKLAEQEDVLDSLLTELRSADNNDDKDKCNNAFKLELESFISTQPALTYNFTKLPTVGVIDSQDKLVRIINWNVEQDDLSHKYYCYVLRYIKKKKKYMFSELKDMSFGMPSQPAGMITEDNWYGALYYKIIPIQKGTRTMYTVLGWDHNSSLSQVKLLDVMYFSGSIVKLGSPVFKIGKTTSYRVFYEHSKKATMYLNYEPDRRRIMMDHLSPESPALKAFRSYYVPDLSYDSFTFTGGKWILKEDVIGTNPNDGEGEKQTVYAENSDGELEVKEIKKTWQNPSDPDAPAGGSTHVAVTPEGEGNGDAKSETGDGIGGSKKRDKRDPNELSSVTGKKKWWKRNKKKKKRKKRN